MVFSGVALVTLGMSMAGRISELRGQKLLGCLVLIATKCLFLPMITKTIVDWFEPNNVSARSALSFQGVQGESGTHETVRALSTLRADPVFLVVHLP